MACRIKLDDRTQDQQKKDFLEQLELTGNISLAAIKSKISRKTVYNWQSSDDTFKAAFRESALIGLDLIDDEIQRRAIHGTKKPVYQGGKKVGYVNELSDTLLIFYAKCKKPDVYKERYEHTGKDGEALNLNPIVTVIHSSAPLARSEKEIDLEDE